MGKVCLLDCTLRDGGYINEWNFGEYAIRDIIRKLERTGIEYIEIGFVRTLQQYHPDDSLFDGTKNIDRMILPKNPHVKYVGMVDMARPAELEMLQKDGDGDGLDVIRVIFKQNKVEEAYRYVEQLLNMGYEVFAQPVGTNFYTQEEWKELILRFNQLPIHGFYIVDSFGMIKKDELLQWVHIADAYLRKDIMLGYHSHNNMQQAMGNAAAMVEAGGQRNLVIDACVFGMGRGAGNLNMELFAQYLNEKNADAYRLEPMLEITDEYLNDIYAQKYWGYSLPLYLSAVNGCHPNYAIYFSVKGNLTAKSYNEIFQSIVLEDKIYYSKEKAEQYYKVYQQNYIDDRVTLSELEQKWLGKEILLLGSGKSILVDEEKIKAYIAREHPIVISLNFVADTIPCDYSFCGHIRRYREILRNEERLGINTVKVITSNLRDAEGYQYMVNFSSYSATETEIMENSGIMLLNLLTTIGVDHVAVAGMDGYENERNGNYVNPRWEYAFSKEEQELRNRLIRAALKKIQSKITIRSLTRSVYFEDEG